MLDIIGFKKNFMTRTLFQSVALTRSKCFCKLVIASDKGMFLVTVDKREKLDWTFTRTRCGRESNIDSVE